VDSSALRLSAGQFGLGVLWAYLLPLPVRIVVDRTERDDVRTERTSAKQNERLLSILGRKSSEKIELFFKALDTTGQHHIRNEITGHEGGTSSVVRPLIYIYLKVSLDDCFDAAVVIYVAYMKLAYFVS